MPERFCGTCRHFSPRWNECGHEHLHPMCWMGPEPDREKVKAESRADSCPCWMEVIERPRTPREERLEALLREVSTAGVELDDPRIGYLTVQIDRDTWNEIKEALR